MSKGDTVTAIVRVGDGSREFIVTATKDGRKVEVERRAKETRVFEKTRGGTVVRTLRVANDWLLALDEQRVENRPKVRTKTRQIALQSPTDGEAVKDGGTDKEGGDK